jgi:outer membrane PBP1 activator LpoA protein
MTEARVEKMHPDRLGARTYLDQAERFQSDADAHLSAESRSVLLHNAALSAANAILEAVGMRVTSGDGSHLLRLETALAQLDHDTEDLLERLDASRSRRNEASYAAMLVAEASVEEAREATAELIELARELLRE